MYTGIYQRKPLPIGIEVFGINLNEPLTEDIVCAIRKDVTKHRLVVFRDQDKVDGEKQVEISKWFGEIDNATYSKHPSSPSVDIFRVSNNPSEGCTGVGMSGWHIDGTFLDCPYAYSIYHMVSPAVQGGDTMFVPLTQVIESLDRDKRKRWDRVWMMSDRRGEVCHPLIYQHPRTGRPTLCFHQGMTQGFVWDYDICRNEGAEPQFLSPQESKILKDEIKNAIDETLVYSHKWQKSGDFVLSDNLAVGHMAGPIPSSIEEAGLRILHRVTVKGSVSPSKAYGFGFPDISNCAY
ncbi:unnamed protein product [Clavelina lepadiformis]|uniref:TauD/TfdA-like domain-containing protein n=1 Tax=Clavelina lepadiformis TaxID=159417 RepID=A0ABP0G3R4_CLALP